MGAERALKNYFIKGFREFYINILGWPSITWILFSYIIVFFAYFIIPTFLNAYHELLFFHDFPVLKPLGADLIEYLNFSKALAETGTPYGLSDYYPPFQAIFFLRFMQSGPDQSYVYMTVLSFVSFLLITFLYPLLSSNRRRLNSQAVLGILTGLFSYGLWFEIERGQFDLLSMAICFLAIYIYHRHPRFRMAAYLLFVISVNLKIYPAIFVLCFTTDWHDWKNNLRRWLLLLAANFASLFILGWKVFLGFVHNLTSQLSRPSYWWIGNHSIDSFVRVMVENFSVTYPNLFGILSQNILWLDLILSAIYLLCPAAVLWMTYHRRMNGANPYLLLIVTLGAMLIPSTSHDYKLCILIGPMVVLFNDLELSPSRKNWLDLAAILLVILISISYFATLFLHYNLPFLLASNFPLLMILSATTVFLLWVQGAQNDRLKINLTENLDIGNKH